MQISVVIPTYRREEILLDTLKYICALSLVPDEVILVDQTEKHQEHVEEALVSLQENGHLRWIRLSAPSIPHAMNVGLEETKSDIVLFLDDDIIPHKNLVAAHARAHAEGHNIVAGQVLQPGEKPLAEGSDSTLFRFNSTRKQHITELMGGNFSIKRKLAIKLGGFDENFVRVAYQFEAEFSDRALAAGEKILFEPAASIRHLKAARGGTRAFGEHLATLKPSHAVGAYYYVLRSRQARHRLWRIVKRPCRAIRTRHHLRRPWWIPLTLVAELLGFIWAAYLSARGPRLINTRDNKCTKIL